MQIYVIITEYPFFQNEIEMWITITFQEQEVKTSKGDLWFLKIQWDASFIESSNEKREFSVKANQLLSWIVEFSGRHK